MKRLLVTTITGLLFMGILVFVGTPAHATMRCTQSFEGAVALFVSPNYGESKWLTTGCGFYIRGRSFCSSRFNGSQYVYGGWVTSRIWSRATCPSNRPSIQQEASQIKHSANGAITTCEEWPNFNC